MSNVSGAIKSIQDIMRKDAGVDGDAQRISQMVWLFFLKIYDDREAELEFVGDDYTSPIPEHLRWRNWAVDREGVTGDALLDFVNLQLFPRLKGDLPTIGDVGKRAKIVRDVFEDANNFMKSGTLMRQVINKINEIDFNNTDDRHTFGDIYEQILKDLQSAGNAGEFYTPRALTRFIIDRLNPRLDEVVFDPACGTGGFLACAIDHKRRSVRNHDDEALLQSTIRGVEKKALPHLLCITNMILHGIDTPSGIVHGNTLEKPYRDYGERDRVPVIATNPPFGGMEQDGIENNFPANLRTRETADLFMALIIKLLKAGGRAAVVLPDGFLFGEGVKTTLKQSLIEDCNLHTIVRLPNQVFAPYTGIKTNILFFTKGTPTKNIWFYEHPYPEAVTSYNKTKPMRFEEFEAEQAWWGDEADGFRARKPTSQAWSLNAEEVAKRGYNLDCKNPHTLDAISHDPDELLAAYDQQQQTIQSIRDQLKSILADALGGPGMSTDVAALVSDNLDLWTSAIERKSGAARGGGKKVSQYGIERLRALILDLAVQGKLVAQDAGEEQASRLLTRVAKRREMIVRRPRKAASGTARNAVAITLPDGWGRVRLEELANPQAGFAFKSNGFNEQELGLPLIRIRDVGQPFTGTYYSGDFRDEFVVRKGDYLIGMDGEFRVATWTGSDALLNQRVARLQFYDEEVVRPFVATVLQMELAKLQGVKAYTTVDHLSGKQIADVQVPLPPLAEQQRIVAKVDELMALCDALESQSASALEAHQALVETLLATLINATDPADLAHQWARLETHFDTLFTTQISIERLRLTVLNLAVRGQLSRQSDWPSGPVKLGSVAGLQNGYAFKSEWFSDHGVRLLRNINIGHDNVDWSELACLSDDMAREYSRFQLSVGDVVLTLDRPFISTGTKVARIKEDDLPALLLQRVARFQLSDKILPEFVHIWVSSPLFSEQIDPGRSNGVPHISTKQVEAATIFVPDVAEQRRIVAKVDELMALCGALKTRVAAGEQTRRSLADAIVERAAA